MIAPLPGTVPPGFGQPPVGVVMAFAGVLGPPVPATASPADTSPPSGLNATDNLEAWGWMLCDGRTLQTQLYPELFAALGYLYGGSGKSFSIPDYRGCFHRGTDLGAGKDPDTSIWTKADGSSGTYDNVGSQQTCALQDHEHDVKTTPAAEGGSGANIIGPGPGKAETEKIHGSSDSWVSSNETRPANVAVNYIIKFTYGLTPFPR